MKYLGGDIIIERIEIHTYNEKNELLHTDIAYRSGQTVYIVTRRFRKIFIIETQIYAIEFTNIVNYRVKYHNHVYRSNNLFTTKEDAYEYAERLERRKNIRFKCR